MKSLLHSLLLVPLIAVIAVNGLYFPEISNDHLELELRNGPSTTTSEPSGDCESNGGECKKNKKQCKGNIDTESTCSKNGVCCVVEVKAQGASELMLQILSNTILIQGMAMQTLKEDQETSITNLNKTILSLKQTVEINNSNLSDIISNQGMALQINQDNIRSNLSDAISNQGMVLQINQDNIRSNLSDGFSNQENILERILDNEDNIMSDLSDGFSDQENILERIEDNQDVIMSDLTRQGCPEGFFQLSPSGQCLKYFNDQRRTWFEANAKCTHEGLVSARPSDPVALQKYLVNTYGQDPSKSFPYVWIPARGSGSTYYIWLQPNGVWNTAGDRIDNHSPYWLSSSFTAPTTHCIYMINRGYHMKTSPGKPYNWNTCTGTYYYTLCELVKE